MSRTTKYVEEWMNHRLEDMVCDVGEEILEDLICVML